MQENNQGLTLQEVMQLQDQAPDNDTELTDEPLPFKIVIFLCLF